MLRQAGILLSREAVFPLKRRPTVIRRVMSPIFASKLLRWNQLSTTATMTGGSTWLPRLVAEHETASAVLANVDHCINSSTGNELLRIYAAAGRWQDAQEVYDQVFRYANSDDIRPTMTTYGLLMEAYICGKCVEDAMEIYYSLKDHIELHPVMSLKKGLGFDEQFYTRLIMALTGTTSAAEIDQQQQQQLISPHLGYTVDDGSHEIMNVDKDCSSGLRMAMLLFQEMRQQGMSANRSIYLSLLKRCGVEKDGYLVEQVYQYLRMDDGIELDEEIVYGLMDAYRQVGDDDGKVFDIWESMGSSDGHVSLVLEMCREKKYKHHAVRTWQQLSSTQQRNASSIMVTCLCQVGEWDLAKEIVSQQHGSPGYSELIELLKSYGIEQGIREDR